MELKDVLGKLGRLDANELNATGQKHIELGECLVKLAETLQTLEAIELPASFESKAKPQIPEPEFWPVRSSKMGRPKRDENRPRSTQRKNLRRDVIALMESEGASSRNVEYLAQKLEAKEQAIRAAITFGKGSPAAYIENGCVVLGEKPDNQIIGQPERLEPKAAAAPKKIVERVKKVESLQHEDEDFDESLADKIHSLLSNEGSMPVPAIAARIGAEPASVGQCCRACPWFCLTREGDIAIAMS